MGIVVFADRNIFNSQTHAYLFAQLPVTGAALKVGCESYSHYSFRCDFDREDYHEAYYQVEKFFTGVTQGQFLKLFIQ